MYYVILNIINAICINDIANFNGQDCPNARKCDIIIYDNDEMKKHFFLSPDGNWNYIGYPGEGYIKRFIFKFEDEDEALNFAIAAESSFATIM